MKSKEELNRLSNVTIGCAIEVHKVLGPGLLESAYHQCLAWELRQQGLSVKEQVSVPMNRLRLGLLLNFNVEVMKKGMRRVVSNF